MNIKPIFKLTLVFSILFLLLTILLYKFQLLGLTDHGFWLSAFYNVINNGEYNSTLLNQNSFLSYPFIYIFTPLGYFIDNPIIYAYLLSYLTYLVWFIVSFLLFFKKTTVKNILTYFLFFFSSVTILFFYNLNYNGYESVFLSVPFLILSYYYAFIKNDYKKSLLFYIPLLLIKSNFWLILVFLFIAIYIKERQLKFIVFSILTFIAMLLYFQFLNYIIGDNSSTSLMHERFSHIFEAKSINELITNIISMENKIKKIIPMLAFFIPFSFLINFKKMSREDMFIFIILIFPTFAYCFLSNHVAMSYWTHEHYSTPLLAIVFIVILKYPAFSKIRVSGYFISNFLLLILILSLKQPWQYKYYQDEDQLLQKIMPILSLKPTDHVLADDRTGIYFTKNQVDYLEFDNNITDNEYKYIIVNTRYIYSSVNLTQHKPNKPMSSYNYISSKKISNNYNILYLNYPFIVYSKENNSVLRTSKNLLNNWDKKTITSNSWFQ